MKKLVHTEKAPAPIGAYSQGTVYDKLIFTSGQLPVDMKSGALVTGDIKAATKAALVNVITVVEAAGGKKDTILKTTVFMKDLEQFHLVNSVYAEVFTENAPARSAFQVARLPKDADIEIEAIAVKE
ncbi:MAG: Rid family detoxifying hydrolase [Candidatus Marinimicrobia bacterium]|nr:Rid family detoxifying hydrolase [Candidatus Neomarinimicrobiota bacterium]